LPYVGDSDHGPDAFITRTSGAKTSAHAQMAYLINAAFTQLQNLLVGVYQFDCTKKVESKGSLHPDKNCCENKEGWNLSSHSHCKWK